ncbi:MAG: coenzyme F420-0:L-glutamate ligase [Patescibacteria group bacterium]|mgnify:CR=1 FL=1
MNIQLIQTEPITTDSGDITNILDKSLSSFEEKSILVVTSKIVSISEGRVVKIGSIDKDTLIQNEAEYYLPHTKSKYDVTLTINHNMLVCTAGIDESNGNGYYILWPKDPQASANKIREYVVKRFGLTNIGIIITDSRSSPLRWGTTGVALSHSGFFALNNYIGEPDIFGRTLTMTKANVADGLAMGAVTVMGEGKEQTPLAVITDVPFVQFQSRNPNKEEIKNLRIDIADDVYAPLLTMADWKKGGKKKK